MKSRKAEGPRLRLSIEEVDMIRELRAQNLENVNDNSALTDHLNERGIDKNDKSNNNITNYFILKYKNKNIQISCDGGAATGKSTGANSIAIAPNGNKLIIVGGDFAKFKDSEKNIAGFNLFLTPNTELKHKSIRIPKWAQRKNLGTPNGYKSGVTFLTNQLLVTCGTSGVDISKNSGKNCCFE